MIAAVGSRGRAGFSGALALFDPSPSRNILHLFRIIVFHCPPPLSPPFPEKEEKGAEDKRLGNRKSWKSNPSRETENNPASESVTTEMMTTANVGKWFSRCRWREGRSSAFHLSDAFLRDPLRGPIRQRQFDQRLLGKKKVLQERRGRIVTRHVH